MQVGMGGRKVVLNRIKYGAGSLIFTQPLFIRLLEHAREDKLSDLDLHQIAEKASRKHHHPLDTDDYDELTEKSTEKDDSD